ncbi:MAG: XTP/dITP diphosphohydrolase [Acidobacteriota bacterium]|nr:XTP/dITP diphosphohydrolase [Acidobacteriota bacterium]
MNTAPELIVATTNAGKAIELAELLAGVGVRLRSLAEFPHVEAAEETGQTFDENAVIKANFYGRLFGKMTLADDSGLEVDGLGGAPGVHSARYAGEGASDKVRVARLLDEMSQSGVQNRSARFVCVVAIYEPATRELRLFRGICEGRIAAEPCGANGFGYDPIFVADGYEESFAQLPSSVKQQISHRARALAEAKTYLLQRFGAASASE